MQTAHRPQSFFASLFAVLFGFSAFFAAGTVQGQPTVGGYDDIDIRTEIAGPLSAQTIKITATPRSGNNSGGGGKISMYAAALVNGVGLFFLDESGVWFPFIDCERTPIVYFGSSGKSVDITVIGEPTDLTWLAGTPIAIGFGIDDAPPIACADMLQWQRYALAHVVGAQ